MLSRFKSALMNAVGASELGLQYNNESDNDLGTNYMTSNAFIEPKPYSRPSFLGLTNEEMQASIFLSRDKLSFTIGLLVVVLFDDILLSLETRIQNSILPLLVFFIVISGLDFYFLYSAI